MIQPHPQPRAGTHWRSKQLRGERAGHRFTAVAHYEDEAPGVKSDLHLGCLAQRVFNQIVGNAVKGFEPLWIERRGDWYLAQKKISEARTEYIKAMKLMEKDKAFPDDSRGLLKVKIDAVGGM